MPARHPHRVRQQVRLIELAGARVVGVSMTGKGHLRFVIAAPGGEQRVLVCSNSPGDHRTDKNTAALVKRLCLNAPSNQDRSHAGGPHAVNRRSG